MNPNRLRLAACLVALAFAGTTALAQTPPPGAAPVPATAAVPTSKLVTNFTDLAGSPENATALVNGLRTGTPITLTDPYAPPSPGGTPAPTTTFSPGTKPMGYGNIRIALSLARAQLASQGVTNPTPAQLQGALVGTSGPGGTTQGVLQMRAAGMGWGQIAHSMGVKLGPVMSGKQTYGPANTAAASSSSGVVTAAGTTTARGSGKGVVTATGGSAHGKSGITTAAGGGGGGNAHVTTGFGQGGGHAGHNGLRDIIDPRRRT